MIADTISRLGSYFEGEHIALVERFLTSLTPDMPDGRVDISGDDIFAMVSTYETRRAEDSRFEAHRKYKDIQLMLAGEEEIGWAPLEGLDVAEPYDEERDVAFFYQPAGGFSRISMRPGMCAVFFPEDAHMPQLMSGGEAATVRKVVIKVSCKLMTRQH
jgi:biofilm protein TabA